MESYIAFGILSLPVIALSWRTLTNIKSHGFYRFFSWECILWLLISNLSYWFDDPLKHVTRPLFLISIISAIFLWFTALFDEKECIKYFGEKYRSYMQRTKRFIPFMV